MGKADSGAEGLMVLGRDVRSVHLSLMWCLIIRALLSHRLFFIHAAAELPHRVSHSVPYGSGKLDHRSAAGAP